MNPFSHIIDTAHILDTANQDVQCACHSPLNVTLSSVSVLQITTERTVSLVEGGALMQKYISIFPITPSKLKLETNLKCLCLGLQKSISKLVR